MYHQSGGDKKSTGYLNLELRRKMDPGENMKRGHGDGVGTPWGVVLLKVEQKLSR